jgi:hypothetical protein
MKSSIWFVVSLILLILSGCVQVQVLEGRSDQKVFEIGVLPKNTQTSANPSKPKAIIPTNIIQQLVTPSPSPTQVAYDEVVLQQSEVYLGPYSSFDIIEVLPRNTKVKIIGQNKEGNWIVIITPNGQLGWIELNKLEMRGIQEKLPVIQSLPTATQTEIPNPTKTYTPIPQFTVTPTATIENPENDKSQAGGGSAGGSSGGGGYP